MADEGKKTKRRVIPDVTKVDAAAEAFDVGSIRRAAVKFKVHPSMVARWQKDDRFRNKAKAKISLTVQEIIRLSSQNLLRVLEDPKLDMSAGQSSTILGIALDKYMALEGISAAPKGTERDPIYNKIVYSFGPPRDDG